MVAAHLLPARRLSTGLHTDLAGEREIETVSRLKLCRDRLDLLRSPAVVSGVSVSMLTTNAHHLSHRRVTNRSLGSPSASVTRLDEKLICGVMLTSLKTEGCAKKEHGQKARAPAEAEALQ